MPYLLFFGLIPPIILLIYIYKLDKIEKEPPKMILRLFLYGIFSVLPAMFLEAIGIAVLSRLGIPENSYLYLALMYFVVVAFSEEFSKRLVGVGMTYKSEEFNYQFDSVVYCAAAALGFACMENISYLMVDGAAVAWGRLIPIHTICGVYMGHYVGLAKSAHRQGKTGMRAFFNFLSVFIPVLIHGFYDFSLSTENDDMLIANMIFTILITFIAFVCLHYFARKDRPIEEIPSKTA